MMKRISALIPIALSAILLMPAGVTEAHADASAIAPISEKEVVASGTSGNCLWEVDGDGVLTVAPIEGTDGMLAKITSDPRPSAPWYRYESQIVSVVVEDGVVVNSQEAALFADMTNLASADLSGLDTSKATNVAGMFHGCSSLKTLDLSSFDTSNVDFMAAMFSGCSSLTSIDLSSFDTSKVDSIGWMFDGCSSLVSLDLSSFDTSRVTNMCSVFRGCSSLESLDLSSFDTSIVADMCMETMFTGCSSLRSVSLGHDFAFDGRTSYLPAPSGEGLTGKWVSSADGNAYEPEDVPSNVEATYTAQVAPCNGNHVMGKWTVIEDATASSEGREERSCLHCRYSETRIIPVLSLGEWMSDSRGWWYQRADGTWPASCWEEIDGRWYCFDKSGYRQTGWIHSGGAWRYLGSDGAMRTGWVYDGAWYYLDPANDGKMATGWIQDGGDWYYLAGSGIMQTGWVASGGSWYYLNSSGIMQTGWLKSGSDWYYFGESGDGAMATGWRMVGGDWYYFGGSNDGVMKTGWVACDGSWYYLAGSGIMQTGWIHSGGSWYYLHGSGKMATGWIQDGGKWYYLHGSGVMATGWLDWGGNWYYLKSSGIMARSEWAVDHYFNASGHWEVVEPDISVICNDYTKYPTQATAFILQNNGGGAVRVVSGWAKLLDRDDESFDRDLILVDENSTPLAWHKVFPGYYDVICFEVDGSPTWYDARTRIRFQFEYDGVMWLGYASAQYGFSYYRMY